MKKLDILAFGAHPDDVELSCAGTILLSVLQGHKVGIIDLTKGEKGTRGTEEIRKQERDKATKILKLSVRESLDIPDTGVEIRRDYCLKVAEKIRYYRPRVIILPPDDRRHPDHTKANRLVFEAAFLSGLKHLEIDGKPYRPFKLLNVHKYSRFEQAKPSFIVDVTRTFHARLKITEAYKSQFPSGSRVVAGRMKIRDIKEWLTSAARYYGMLIGVKYGEGFVMRETMQVDDLTQLKVASM